jgi:hypothetical protein
MHDPSSPRSPTRGITGGAAAVMPEDKEENREADAASAEAAAPATATAAAQVPPLAKP